jgi:hypothetical protein
MSGNLKTILEKFKSRLAYRQMDKEALNISRSLAGGNLGTDKKYAQWASITNDPLVVVNYVGTFITELVSKLSSAPFRPESDDLFELGRNARFDARFNENYKGTLNDGYSYVGVGVKNKKPILKEIDARYILHNGEDMTLRDATDVFVFEVVPCSIDERANSELLTPSFLSAYVEYDCHSERVKVSHYHKNNKTGKFVLDFYDLDYDKPQTFVLEGLDRIPVVRFVGSRVELEDRRWHYRGVYYQVTAVIKALALSATKIQIRVSASTDANFIARKDAIDNHEEWKNSGTLTVDNTDENGNPIPPVQPVEHDNQFLIESFNLWKGVIADMLGPTVSSGSEAVTREEVKARNEVKDAISNLYLARAADSIEEVYRIVQMFIYKKTDEVKIVGGFIESVKRKKEKEEMMGIYQLAKEGGMNTQGLVVQMLAISDLPRDTKEAIALTFEQDPFKSPQVIALQGQVAALQQTIQNQNMQIALLRLQATQRLERQKEFIDSTERTKRLEIAQKQWSEEQKQTQEARMEVLKDCLAKGDYEGAIAVLEQIQQESNPLITDKLINLGANAFTEENNQSVQTALAETQQTVPVPQAPVAKAPAPQVPQVHQPRQAPGQAANVTAPAPRPAVTPFNDA